MASQGPAAASRATNCMTTSGHVKPKVRRDLKSMSRQVRRVSEPPRVCFTPAGITSCGQLLIARSSYSKRQEGLVPWVLGGQIGKKGESPWQVGEQTKCHLRSSAEGG